DELKVPKVSAGVRRLSLGQARICAEFSFLLSGRMRRSTAPAEPNSRTPRSLVETCHGNDLSWSLDHIRAANPNSLRFETQSSRWDCALPAAMRGSSKAARMPRVAMM